MAFYFIIFGVLVLFAFIELLGLNKRTCRVLFVLFSLFFFALSFLRWETGTDWETYYSSFDSIQDWFTDNGLEPGYALINEFAKLQFDSFTVMLFVCGAILFAFQSAAILNLSPLPIMSLLFLWSTQAANVLFVRQWIACAILFYSVKYIVSRRFLPFIFLVVLATMFHRTALIFLFSWWFYKIRWKPWILYAILLGSIGCSSFAALLMEHLGTIAGGIVQYKLEVYMGDSSNTFGQASSLAFTIIKGFANKIIIIIFSFIMLRKIEANTPEFRGYLNLYWFGCILYFMTISISVALVRLSFPFDILQIVLLPYIIVNLPNKQWKFTGFMLVCLYFTLRLFSFLFSSYYESFVPFKTIFNY